MNDKTEENLNNDDKKHQNELNNVSELKKQEEADPLAQIRNDYLYLRAEFDNYKKNMIKERSELIKYGGERLAYDLLDVLDVFEKALQTEVNENNYQSFKKGIEITALELKKILEKHGIHEIPSMGAKFDPTKHEAISQVPSKEYKENTIIDVFKKGYKYLDKILRHAQVVVSKESND